MSQLSLFDYAQLPEPIQVEVKQHVTAAKSEMRTAAESIVNIGCEISALRKLLTDGQFEELLRAEFGYALRTGLRYIRIYNVFGGYDFNGFGYVTVEVLDYLSRDEVPPEAQLAAVNLLNSGQELTKEQAKEIVDRHRPRLPLEKEKSYQDIISARDEKLRHRWPVELVEQLAGCMSAGCDYPIATRAHRLPWSIVRENNRVLYLCPNCHHTYDTLFFALWDNSPRRKELAQAIRAELGNTPGFKWLAEIVAKEILYLEQYQSEQEELAAHVNGRNGND